MKIILCELRSGKLNEGWSWQLYTQLLHLRKESPKKKIRLVRDSNPWPLRYQCSLIGRALHRYRRGQGFESRTSRIFFSGFLLPAVKVVYITAMIILHLSFCCCCCCCCCYCLVLFFHENVMCWGFTEWKKASRTVTLHTETLIQCPTKHIVIKAN